MNGGMIPHHRQAAYDAGHEAGWFEGYQEGRQYTRRATALISFSMGILAAIAFYGILRWFV